MMITLTITPQEEQREPQLTGPKPSLLLFRHSIIAVLKKPSVFFPVVVGAYSNEFLMESGSKVYACAKAVDFPRLVPLSCGNIRTGKGRFPHREGHSGQNAQGSVRHNRCSSKGEDLLIMINIQRILCPTDLSVESDEALRYSLALALAYEAKLTLVYCKRPSSVSEWVNSSRAQQLFEQSLFTHLDAKELKVLDWQGVVAEGDDVGLTITKEAAERNADLIVMRSRRRPHAAVLLGSTAETVSRNAPCPVLVTHPNEREWVGLSTSEMDLQRVLVAYDFSPDSNLALNYAISLAQEYQAEVHLVHVISKERQDEPEVAWTQVGVESLYKDVAQRLQQAVPKEAFLWCNVVNVVRCGRPPVEILAYAKEKEIDIVCMGASGAGFRLGTLLGSTVDRVLRRAPCPVFVARPMASGASTELSSGYAAGRLRLPHQPFREDL